MKELGVQMIAAYSPQARGRSERSFGTWQGRLPQELRLAGISTVEGANAFLRERYIAEFNGKFSVPAAEKGTAFRRTRRSDLNWIFTVQTERVVDKDNTVAIGDRLWQIDKTRFRNTLAGKHGNDPRTPGRNRVDPLRPSRGGTLRAATGEKLIDATAPKSAVEKAGAWKPAKTKSRFPPAPTLPWKSRPKREIPTFPPRRLRLLFCPNRKAKAKPKTKAAA